MIVSMSTATELLACVDAYCAARKIARPTLSGRLLKDSRTLDRVAAGGGMNILNFDACMSWLSAHWPDDVPWPDGVRPREVFLPRARIDRDVA